MTTKYAVFNPSSGENDMYDTVEEALQAFWTIVISYAVKHMHNTAYMVVQQNEDGSETWFNDNNNEIERPLTREEILQKLQDCKPPPQAQIANPTPVEILP